MREVYFLKQNRDKWKEFEQKLNGEVTASPDEVADLFIQVNEDLSYARTFYPKSNTVKYLNQLAARVYLNIYKNKQEPFRRILDFWVKEVPNEVIKAKYAFMISATVFVLMILAGVISTFYDDTFPNYYFGDYYMEMTLKNIREGNPTGVYQHQGMMDMFFSIAYNNVMVEILCFIKGIFLGIGTLQALISNGVMIGTFFSIFYLENVHAEAWRIIMIHGTIEICTIIISGAAGLCLGIGILFPGTHPRKTAFMSGAKSGLKIMLGVFPFTLLAAFLEGFVTRHVDMLLFINILIIAFSLFLMLGYWLIYPIYRFRKIKNSKSE